MNKVIEKIINECDKVFKDKEFIRVYISKDKMYNYQVADIMGTKMFDCKDDKLGYLFFMNTNTMANYSHKCSYWFFS